MQVFVRLQLNVGWSINLYNNVVSRLLKWFVKVFQDIKTLNLVSPQQTKSQIKSKMKKKKKCTLVHSYHMN